MDKITCMRAFVAVVDAGGFSRAARKTHTTKALLSKYVAQLENQLDVRLLHRTTRTVNPSDVGRAYYERCRVLLDELDEMDAVVQDSHTKPRGELKISAPTSFAELHLMAIVATLRKQYPELRINLMLTDRVVDIVEEGVDLALRIADMPDSSLIARRITDIPTVVCASSTYLKSMWTPQHPDDLRNHPCIVDTNIKAECRWEFLHHTQSISVKLDPVVQVNSAVAVKELLLNDAGISLSPRFAVAEEIRDGRIKIILPDYESHAFALYAVYSHRKHLSAKVQLFIDALRAGLDPAV